LYANVVIYKASSASRAQHPRMACQLAPGQARGKAQKSSIQKKMQTVLLHMAQREPRRVLPGENGLVRAPPLRSTLRGGAPMWDRPHSPFETSQPGRWTMRVSPPFQLATRSSEMMLTWLPDVPTKCIPRLRMA
jgi:hypothetical protein